MSETVEQRLTRIERELAILKSQANSDKSNWVSEIKGSFKNDPDFDEITKLGKELRDAEEPEDS